MHVSADAVGLNPKFLMTAFWTLSLFLVASGAIMKIRIPTSSQCQRYWNCLTLRPMFSHTSAVSKGYQITLITSA